MQTVLARERKPRPEVNTGRRGLFTNPQGLATYLMLRPLSDLFLWAWRLERRLEFLYRPWFDRRLRPPLFSAAQAVQNARRETSQLRLAEEQLLPGEEACTRQIIDELTKFTRDNWLPGGAQRFGNTKTFGVLRGEFSVLPGLPAGLRRGLFAQPATYPAWVRFSGPGPYAPPDIEDDRRIEKGPRRFMDTSLLRGLRLAARAERDRQADHFAGSRTSDSEVQIVHGHMRDDDLHISSAFPAHLVPVLVARCKRIERQAAIRRDPVLAHLAKLLEADAVRSLHGGNLRSRGARGGGSGYYFPARGRAEREPARSYSASAYRTRRATNSSSSAPLSIPAEGTVPRDVNCDVNRDVTVNRLVNCRERWARIPEKRIAFNPCSTPSQQVFVIGVHF